MKKFLLILVGLISVLSVGCDPMDEIYDDIDTSLKVEGAVDLTLTEDDYASLELEENSFNTLDDAKALIPSLLESKYPAFTERSLANVYFNLFDPTVVEEYTVLESEYTTEEKYFTSSAGVKSFLSSKYDTAAEGKVVEVTYKTIAAGEDYILTDENYDDIASALISTYPGPAGNLGDYGNFGRYEGSNSYWSYEMIIEGFNEVLIDELSPNEGQLYNVTFDTYGPNAAETIIIRYDGNLFVEFGEAPQGEAYTLVNPDDYVFIGDELLEVYPGPADNIAEYKNFDRRADNSDYWSTSMIEEALDILLQEKNASASEGDVFNVTYRIYDGSGGTEDMTMIKEGGSFVMYSSISITDETTLYSYVNGDWEEPIMLETADYTAMGQSFPNFDDEDDVAYKIGIYLDDMFPYAEEGDYKTVGYAFYNGSTSTKYSNFVFENGGFTLIRDTIETSFQFGITDGVWQPDNTIQYTFTSADYALVASELAVAYPSQAGNLQNYGNFNRGGGSTSWDDAMMLDAFRVVLNNIDPSAEEAQKYQMIYTIYAGGYTTQISSVIKVEGVWEYQN